MINLLPELYKKAFIKEYHLRIVVTGAAFCLSVAIAAVALLIPAYISSKFNEDQARPLSAASTTSTSTSVATIHAQLVAQTATLSAVLTALSLPAATAPSFTTIIPVIFEQKPSGISVTSITYAEGGTVAITGIANTRDELAAFQNALQNQPAIASVSLPISDFAADTDIQFSITITPTAH